MARLPSVGGDSGNWGEILNEFLLVAHNPDGQLKLSTTVANKYELPAGGVPESDLSGSVQTKLNNVGSGTSWGAITGILTDQTDLDTAFNLKADTTHNHNTLYAQLSHQHNNLYYTENEVDTFLSGKSDTTHVHDTQYPSLSSFNSHTSATAGVHGITDTAALETQIGAQTKADAAESSANGYTDTQIAAQSYSGDALSIQGRAVSSSTPSDQQVLAWSNSTSQWIPAAQTGAGGGGTSDHGALTGLGDDDHPQYHTDARASTWLSGQSSDNVTEGSTNLYLTDTRVSGNSNVAANTSHRIATNNPHSVSAAQVGLSNVDNTSDTNKPISTAAQSALDGKADSSHTHTLNSLSDVTVSGASDGQVLKFNSGSWAPATDNTGAAGSTNLAAANRTPTTLDITSSSGTDATLPSASATEAGLISSADQTKLNSVATGAEVNVVDSVNTQTGAVVLDADDISDAATSNKFTTAAEQSKLAGVETNATADQTDAEIEAAYHNQVGFVSQTEAEAGTVTSSRRWSPERVSQAIAALAPGGGGSTDHGALTGLGDDDHTQYHNDARAATWLGTQDTGDLSEGSNLYYTEGRVSANTNVSANTSHRNTTTGNPHSISVSDLLDVDVTGLSSGQVLKYDGTDWVPGADINGGSGSVDAASIVVVSSDVATALGYTQNTPNVYVCSGTNDHVTINLAMVQASQHAGSGSGQVQLTGGDFDIRGSILMYPACTLKGVGHRTILKSNNMANDRGIVELFNINTHLTTLRDLTIDGDYAAGGGSWGIYYTNNSGTTKNPAEDGNLGTYTPGSNPDAAHRIYNLYITNFTGGANTRHAVYMGDNCRDTQIEHVRVSRTSGSGFVFDGASDNKSFACVASDCSEYGYLVQGGSNIFVQCKAAYCDLDGFRITSSRSLLSACESQDSGEYGLYVSGIDAKIGSFNSDSNMRLNTSAAGIAVAADRITLSDIIVSDRSQSANRQDRGIEFVGTPANVRLSGLIRLPPGQSDFITGNYQNDSNSLDFTLVEWNNDGTIFSFPQANVSVPAQIRYDTGNSRWEYADGTAVVFADIRPRPINWIGDTGDIPSTGSGDNQVQPADLIFNSQTQS